jgi:hypothetical protein
MRRVIIPNSPKMKVALIGVRISKPPPLHNGIITKYIKEHSAWFVDYRDNKNTEYMDIFDVCDFVLEKDRSLVDKFLENLSR